MHCEPSSINQIDFVLKQQKKSICLHNPSSSNNTRDQIEKNIFLLIDLGLNMEASLAMKLPIMCTLLRIHKNVGTGLPRNN